MYNKGQGKEVNSSVLNGIHLYSLFLCRFTMLMSNFHIYHVLFNYSPHEVPFSLRSCCSVVLLIFYFFLEILEKKPLPWCESKWEYWDYNQREPWMDDKNKYGWKEVVHSFYFSQQNKKRNSKILRKKQIWQLLPAIKSKFI